MGRYSELVEVLIQNGILVFGHDQGKTTACVFPSIQMYLKPGTPPSLHAISEITVFIYMYSALQVSCLAGIVNEQLSYTTKQGSKTFFFRILAVLVYKIKTIID